MSFDRRGTTQAQAIVSTDDTNEGNYVCDGTADNVQLQLALDYVNDLGGGVVFIKDGTYDIASAITMYKTVRLIGDCRETVILSMSANDNCIEIDSTNTHAWYEMAHFRIDMNRYDGHAIYSLNPSASTWTKPYIHDIDIYDVDTSQYGMYLRDHFHTNIQRISIYTYGGGIEISKQPAGRNANLGNSYWQDLHILLQGNDGIGINCVSLDNSYIMNLMEFHRVQIMGQPQGGPPDDTIGIYFKGVQNTAWYNLNIEDIHFPVHLTYATARDSFHNHFYAPYIYNVLDTGWFLDGAAHATLISGGITYGNANYNYRDTTSSDGKENNITAHKFLGTGDLDYGRKTVIHNMASDTKYEEIALPFNAALQGATAIHPTQGDAAVPTSGTIYYARVLNYYISVSGGTVSNIQLYDKGGNEILTGITSTTGLVVPRGYGFEVTHTLDPTVDVFPWGD